MGYSHKLCELYFEMALPRHLVINIDYNKISSRSAARNKTCCKKFVNNRQKILRNIEFKVL